MTQPEEAQSTSPSAISRARELLTFLARFDTKDAKTAYDKLIGLNVPLFIVGTVYASGFLVWSIHLAGTPFSPPSISPYQYVLSGLGFIFTSVVLFTLVTLFLKMFSHNITGWFFPMFVFTVAVLSFFTLGGTDADMGRVVQVGGLIFFVFAVPLLFIAIFFSIFFTFGAVMADAAILHVFIPSVDHLNASSKGGNLLAEIPRVHMFTGITLAVIVVNLFSYAWVVHPAIPQALGGAQPLCAQLEVDASKLSANVMQTLSETGPFGPPTPTKNVARTRVLDVYYADEDRTIVAPMDYRQKHDLLELRNDAIMSVVWCNVDRGRRAFEAFLFAVKERWFALKEWWGA